MQRVLDIDLDFFLFATAHWREYDAGRLDAAEYPPWPPEQALQFLRDQCGLVRRLPGFVVEHHGELFARWRAAIVDGVLSPPFSLTHVDAHADLGLGDPSWVYLMSEVLFLPVESRTLAREGADGVNDGSWVSFAIACRWLSDLTYVFNGTGHPGDLHPYLMNKSPTAEATHVELAAVARGDQDACFHDPDWRNTVARHLAGTPWRAHLGILGLPQLELVRSPSEPPV